MITPSAGTLYRPYAPHSNFIEVLRRLRARNLPEFIDAEHLKDGGASQATASRLLGALRFLGLIEPDGKPTPQVRALARSGEEEYRNLLSGILRQVYQDVFAAVDPAQDAQAMIMNAFMRFEPASQHYRMVLFFLGLCREAGIPIMDEPRRRNTGIARPTRKPRDADKYATVGKRRRGLASQQDFSSAAYHPLIKGMLDLLPEPGSQWGTQRKTTWLETMKLNLDQVYPNPD